MTGRAILDQRIWRIMLAVYSGGGAFFLSILLSIVLGIPHPLIVGVVGWAAAFLGMFYGQQWGIRCPYCQGNLGNLVMYRGGMSLDSRIRFCPYCSARFDEEYNPIESLAES